MTKIVKLSHTSYQFCLH